MSRRDRVELAIWVAVLMLAAAVAGQQPAGDVLRQNVLRQGVLRQIDDPGAHGVWLLTRDPVHPAGPGRMVWVPDRVRLREASGDAAARALSEPLKPVILAGDRVVVEEETPVVDARLAAVALNPAPAGMGFNARLEIGGQVVRAIAEGPGLARLAPQTGGQP